MERRPRESLSSFEKNVLKEVCYLLQNEYFNMKENTLSLCEIWPLSRKALHQILVYEA